MTSRNYIVVLNPNLPCLIFDDAADAKSVADQMNEIVWNSHPWLQPFFGDFVTVTEAAA